MTFEEKKEKLPRLVDGFIQNNYLDAFQANASNEYWELRNQLINQCRISEEIKHILKDVHSFIM
jgi:hypothetical protein